MAFVLHIKVNPLQVVFGIIGPTYGLSFTTYDWNIICLEYFNKKAIILLVASIWKTDLWSWFGLLSVQSHHLNVTKWQIYCIHHRTTSQGVQVQSGSKIAPPSAPTFVWSMR